MPQNTPRGYTYPLYGDTTDFPAQIQDFATDVDTDVAALVASLGDALDSPTARISASGLGSTSFAGGVNQTLLFSLSEYDNAGMTNIGLNPDRITFTEIGIYLLSASCNWNANTNGTAAGRALSIVSSVSGVRTKHGIATIQNQASFMSLTTLHEVTVVGEFITLVARHNFPVNDVAAGGTARTLTATKISEDN